MWRSMPAPTSSASCSFRRRRAISASRRRARSARGCAAAPARSRSRSMPTTRWLEAIVEALEPDMLQLHGNETPERVAAVRTRFGLPVMKALPIADAADLVADPTLRRRRRPALVRRARAARGDPAGRARQERSTGRLLENLDPACRSCCRAGSMPAMSPRRCASRARRRRCLFRRRARARREGPGQDPRLHPRARAAARMRTRMPCTRLIDQRVEARAMSLQQPNSFRTGPDERGHFGIYGGRFVAETLMPLILELEQAYARGQGRSGVPARDGRLSRRIMSAARRRSISPSA